jgi:SAM-dependent methyltransferase
MSLARAIEAAGMETLSEPELERIRASRRQPRRTQYDYLHLRRLLDDLTAALGGLEHPVADVLDVYCGTRPYEDLLPAGSRVIGLDVDNQFGAADVVSREFLPFDDESFDLVMCIEAFYYVRDPVEAASEIRRVLRPGGTALIAVPYAWEYDRHVLEHRWTAPELEALFAGWDGVRTIENGGRGVTWATLTGRLVRLGQGRLPVWARILTRPLFAGGYLLVNAVGAVIERGERRRAHDPIRLPMNLMLIARRPPAA